MKLLKIAKFQMFLSLFGVAVFAIIGNFSLFIILRYLIIFGFTIGLEYLLWKVRNIPPFVPLASFVTATIVFLLSDPTTIILLPLLAIIFAVLQKQFIRPWGNHIFNPAGFGLLISSFFGNVISWWGPNTGTITFWIIILACGYVSQIRVNHWKITIPYLLTTVVITFILTKVLVLSQLLVGASMFFAFVMIVEPATAPDKNWNKVFYGISIGALSFVTAQFSFFQDPMISALLIGNLGFEVLENIRHQGQGANSQLGPVAAT